MNIKSISVLFVCLYSSWLISCGKKDVIPPAPLPEPSADLDMRLDNIFATDITEFDIIYKIIPDLYADTYTNVYLYWSTDNSFKTNSDSLLLYNSGNDYKNETRHLKGLKPGTKYFTRLKATVKDKFFYSQSRDFDTDILKISSPGEELPFTYVSRSASDPLFLSTNFKTTDITHPDTSQVKITLGSYNCPVIDDAASTISFHIPVNIPSGQNYTLTLKRNGLTAQTTIPFYVLKNLWTETTPPVVPQISGEPDAIFLFGSCQSATKGYMVGGRYRQALNNIGQYDNSGPFSIREFDGQTNQWSEINPINPRSYESPVCYYFNNSIYVLWGMMIWPGTGNFLEQDMWRFDLATNSWIKMDPLPYPSVNSPVSFELNGEWYIGAGFDFNTLDLGGNALPSRKFWKYSPATNQWTTITDFPGQSQMEATGFTIGSNGYIFNGATASQELWEYNNNTNNWSQITLPSKGPSAGTRFSVVDYNGKAYFFLNQNALEYDPVNAAFSPVARIFNGPTIKLIYNHDNQYYFQENDGMNHTYKLTFD